MPANSNPDKHGEGYRLYYRTGGTEYDTTTADASILAEASWVQLCQVDVNLIHARNLEATEDACTGDNIEYTSGKVDWGATATVNEFRLTVANVRAFNTLADSNGIVPIMVIDADTDDPDVTGVVMNALVGQNDTTGPQSGKATRSIEFRPAARSQYKPKRIYGADVT